MTTYKIYWWQIKRILDNVRAYETDLEKYVEVMDLQVLVISKVSRELSMFLTFWGSLYRYARNAID